MSAEAIATVERPAAAELMRPQSEDVALVPMVERDPYAGIAEAAFSTDQRAVLSRPVDLADLDILPTGEVYLSQIGYRRRLFEAFGAGGWGMKPLSKPTMSGNTLMQEWALYILGRFVGSAWGEAEYQDRNPRYSYATAAEALKSNALMRCCKDIGIASECWDRRFTQSFMKEHCVKVWRAKGGRDKKGEYQWRRKDAPAFYDEGKSRSEALSDVDAEPGEERPASTPPPAAASKSAGAYITAAQVRTLLKAGSATGWKGDDFAKFLKDKGYGQWDKVPAADFAAVLDVMEGAGAQKETV